MLLSSTLHVLVFFYLQHTEIDEVDLCDKSFIVFRNETGPIFLNILARA